MSHVFRGSSNSDSGGYHQTRRHAPAASAASSSSVAPTDTKPQGQGSIQTIDSIPYVQVRSLDVTERVAFERRSLPVPVSDHDDVPLDKISPSPQHVEILQKLYGRDQRRKVRQLCWSPAVSPHADPWNEWNDDDADNDDEGEAADNEHADPYRRRRRQLARKRRMLSKKRASQISRYSAIDPLEYARSTLPGHSPVLSNTRIRLPVRSDVGFPGASDEEIRAKHMEIMRETELEEHSPRIVLLIGSGDLCDGPTSDKVDILSSEAKESMEEYEGLPDIPFAGRELVTARIKSAKSCQSHFLLGGDNSTGNNANDMNAKKGDVMKALLLPEALRPLPGPDPCSIFAPPVGSTHSSTHIWRSTPFADQSPGMINVISIPASLTFDIGSIEPLVCSLALYCLPPPPVEGRRPSRVWSYRGKISEDFLFPAGEWPSSVKEDLLKKMNKQFHRPIPNRNIDEDESGWERQTSKAIFSYDPLAFPPNVRDSLFIVLQVQKVAQLGAKPIYLSSNNNTSITSEEGLGNEDLIASPKELTRKRSMSGKIKKKLVGRSKKAKDDEVSTFSEMDESIAHSTRASQSFETSATDCTVDDISAARESANSAFNQNGTEFLSAIGLGVLPLFPKEVQSDESVSWPSGSNQTMKLFSYPDDASHDDYIEKLAAISQLCHGATDESSSTGDEHEILHPISGGANFFTSIIGVDFTQVLLQSPVLSLHNGQVNKQETTMPRLLADSSGDCAIMMSPGKNSMKVKKRSDLVRLPCRTPSCYADLSEVREVLYLPPRPERLYDNDVPTYSNRLMNFLYLYPKQIRLEGNEEGASWPIAVRISLVRRQGNQYIRTDSIYSRSPFGKPMLNAVFTNISQCKSKKGETKAGISMHDEIKVRLPDVLDGSYFLHFSLCSLRQEESVAHKISPILISETFVPLSSSSAKEPVSKERVVCIIPNGVHRIKLGSYQLMVESRLVSSIHTSDPGVSMTLRDFKYSEGIVPDNIALPSTICKVMERASGQAVVTHFQTLIFLHVHNLLNCSPPELPFKDARRFFGEKGGEASKSLKKIPSPSQDMKYLMDIMRSLLIIMSKSRSRFCGEQSRHIRHWNILLMRKFHKEFIDVFDESLFSSRSVGLSDVDESSVAGTEALYESTDDDAIMEETIDAVLDALEDSLIEKTVNVAVISTFEQYSEKTKGRNAKRSDRYRRAKSEGLLRTAYGASKTDQMKAEAELHEGRLAELFDDDETVVTTATFMSRKSLGGGKRLNSAPSGLLQDPASIRQETTPQKTNASRIAESMRQWGLAVTEDEGESDQELDTSTPVKMAQEQYDRFQSAPLSYAGEKAKSMAQRINTVAQVMMTPCMAPNLSSILARKSATSPQHRPIQNEMDKSPLVDLAQRDHLKAFVSPTKETSNAASISIRRPGSDVEENGEVDVSDQMKDLKVEANEPKVKLRGSQTFSSSRLELSIKESSNRHPQNTEEDVDQSYLYECIFALWFQAWLEHSMASPVLQQNGQESSSLRMAQSLRDTTELFAQNIDILFPLCMKSFAMRCSVTFREAIPSIIVDSKHMQIFEPIVEISARSLVSATLINDRNKELDWDAKLVATLSKGEAVLDFIVGLLSIVHPAQVSILIFRYFKTLRLIEDQEDGDEDSESEGTASSTKFRRLICSRQLRLRAAERFSTVPRFVALNFPYKYGEDWVAPGPPNEELSWVGQSFSSTSDPPKVATPCSYPDGYDRLPHAHWLAELLANECFSICLDSCEAVVTEAIAQIKATRGDKARKSALRHHSSTILTKSDLLRLQSNALHAISIVYELLVRRHAFDERFQTRENRSRIAAMYVSSVFSNTIKAVPWLSKMESTHKIRTLWLLSFLHVVQKAPELLTREKLRSYCKTQQGYPRLHRFVRILRLGSSTCQGFITKHSGEIQGRAWLAQESYNTICAMTIIVVDECGGRLSRLPQEQKKLADAVYDVLLHVLSMPLSPVAHQRALGGASQALSKFGTLLTLEVIGDRLQHWARICLSLMNAPSLSVRSIAVDFVLSLFSGCYNEGGNMDELSLVFLTVLPEVVAREMALYSVAGLLEMVSDVERSVWPLRRALADMEEADPQDDDRIDPQMSPFLSTLCRGCQAIIDGVLIELRLKGNRCTIVGSNIKVPMPSSPQSMSRKTSGGALSRSVEANNWRSSFAFDADEESVFEAASSFLPETAPLQRLRWLLTLKSIHRERGHWVEAAEALMLCASTIVDAISHVRHVWRPSRFALWRDSSRSVWLSTVGEKMGLPDRSNAQVVEFADDFLEPSSITGRIKKKPNSTGMLQRPSVSMLCVILCGIAQDAIDNYLKEEGLESHAFHRFEQLLKALMDVTEEYGSSDTPTTRKKTGSCARMEENAALRKASAVLNGHITRLAERLLLLAEEEDDEEETKRPMLLDTPSLRSPKVADAEGRQFYVRVELLGRKTSRFLESTSLPTFLEWESPSICRVPKQVMARATSIDSFMLSEDLKGSPSIEQALRGSAEQRLCLAYAEPLLIALSHEISLNDVVFSCVRPSAEVLKSSAGLKTFVIVSIGYGTVASLLAGKGVGVEQTKRFLFKNTATGNETGNLSLSSPGLVALQADSFVEYTVAREFPCALSRQRTLLTSEFVSNR